MPDSEYRTAEEDFDTSIGDDEYIEEDKAPERVALTTEPLFAGLLRQAVEKLWPGDAVMADFVTHIGPHLSSELALKTAKGGQFVEERRAEGREVARFQYDQSLRAHLVNGLLPTLRVAVRLREWGAPQLRRLDDTARRIFIVGYLLHDWLKLPEVEDELTAVGLTHDSVNPNLHRPLVEDIFRRWGQRLGLDRFLEPIGGLDRVLHDVIYNSCNTQVRWGTLRNLSALPDQTLDGRTRQLLADLSRLADLLAYVARTPPMVAQQATIRELMATLSDRGARFTYHHVADNRGVLTNLIHNAALEALSTPTREPILYAPSGVVYLERNDAPTLPPIPIIAEATVQKVQAIGRRQLQLSKTGFRRDGKGMKYADYYWLYFDTQALIRLAVGATVQNIPPSKKPSAGTRFATLLQKGLTPADADLDLADDVRVDQLAEFCFVAEKIVAERYPKFDVVSVLLNALDLADLKGQVQAIPRDNRTGGVGYHWYFAAGHYLKRHPGLSPDEWQAMMEQLALTLTNALPSPSERNEVTAPPGEPHRDGWDDLRVYVRQVLTIGTGSGRDGNLKSLAESELMRYTGAKKRGRGSTLVCSLCSSSFTVSPQQEAGVLFAPQVYSNKQPLHGNRAIRNICSICGLEMMLRQILMNRSAASGGRFEGRRVRYLYLYPSYFFTPETLEVIRIVHNRLRRLSFTELRKQLLVTTNGQTKLRLDADTLQRLEALLLDPTLEEQPEQDRFVRMHYPKNEPITFFFMGVPPPSRDAKDAEAWVHPAFLALLLPILLDVKVVASEASTPLLVEAEDLPETVFLDAPHAFVSRLTRRTRLNLDQVLPALSALTVGYLIHLDANSGMGRAGWDYRWQELPVVARDLETSPLYVFHYLKQWQRGADRDGYGVDRARLYLDYVTYFDERGKSMSHAQELTKLYRGFYRAEGYKSNAILKPIQVAARVILEADPRLFDSQGLLEAVEGELNGLVSRVVSDRAEGRLPPGSTLPSRAEAVRAFSEYFVNEVFMGALAGDHSALRGRQLNLLKNACEAVYLKLDAEDREARRAATVEEQ